MLSTIFHHSARPRASRRTLRPTLIIASPPNPEVVRLVIDHLSHDRPTLTTCSLVAKAWAQSAQSHLFRKLCVSGDGSFFLSAAIPDRFTSRRAEARNVQELTIMSRTPGKHARLHRDAFLSIITRLPKLRQVHLQGLSWEILNTPPASPSVLLQIPSGLKTVTLHSVEFISARWGDQDAVLQSFLSSVPFVENLGLTATNFSPGWYSPVPQPMLQLTTAPHALKMLRLRIGSDMLPILVETLRRSSADLTLRCLDVCIPDAASCNPMQTMITSCGLNLRSCRIRLSNIDPHFVCECHSSDLSCLTKF